ncbi:unnamed protein product [Polarella glacialis]|uniref:Uncharacterized protein n=1 Tax=Polarella glacialis TaxID=89957 RepID=A0A813HPZ7_POLGL|nr:unnamed protein product [Polarella glacialis]
MPLTHSTGLFPSSRSMQTLSAGDLQKLFSSTSSGRYDGRQLKEDDKNESLSDVHRIGTRDTKYHKFPLCTAPMLNRGACKYTQEYSAMPLGESQCVRVLHSLCANVLSGMVCYGGHAVMQCTIRRMLWATCLQDEWMREAKPKPTVSRLFAPRPSHGWRIAFADTRLYKSAVIIGVNA